MARLSRVGAGEATTCLRVGSTGNRCLNFSDPFGLWPPGVHDDMIKHALAAIGVSAAHISAIQQASRAFDSRTQSKNESFMHSMRAPDQTATAAIAARDEFVAGELNTAKGLATEGDEAGALTHLAQAMHPVMDQTSPEHVDANGQPKAWGGVASPGAVGHAIREHFD